MRNPEGRRFFPDGFQDVHAPRIDRPSALIGRMRLGGSEFDGRLGAFWQRARNTPRPGFRLTRVFHHWSALRGLNPRPPARQAGALPAELRADVWWSRRGSNPRPSACHADALPAELRPHVLLGVPPLVGRNMPRDRVRNEAEFGSGARCPQGKPGSFAVSFLNPYPPFGFPRPAEA